MSLLFLESPSVRDRLSDVLRDAGGIAGVIDVETDEFRVLNDPAKSIRLDRRAYLQDDYDPEDGGSDYDVDGFAEALLTRYTRILQAEVQGPIG